MGGVIGGAAVPLFFMMSAYWLFRFDVHDRNAMNILVGKIKKKVKTICLPYLLWNTFGMIFYMVITRIPFAANMMNHGTAIPITLSNVVEGIFLHKYYFTFWYMQDLIGLIAISPIILIILKSKYTTLITIIATAIAVLFKIDFTLFNGTSFLFFMIGAYMVAHANNYFESESNKAHGYFGAFVLAEIIRYMNAPIAAELAYFVSPILLWKSADVLFQGIMGKRIGWFTTQSFFIYASHVIPVTVIGHLLAKVSQTHLWATISYLLAPWITLSLIYVAAEMLYKYTPEFYGLICGGRLKNER